MQLQFKNSDIFFAIESIWPSLDYRFKYHINQIVTANPADDYLQTVTIDEKTLIAIYTAVSNQTEGVAAIANKELTESFLPQIMPLANMEAVIAETEEPNEAARILIAIDAINKGNQATRQNKIISGKAQVLS